MLSIPFRAFATLANIAVGPKKCYQNAICRVQQVRPADDIQQLEVVPLFAAQSPEQQAAAFQAVPPDVRKVQKAVQCLALAFKA